MAVKRQWTLLTGREERQMVSNVTVIQCEACITQHKLMICVVKLKENVRKRREVFVIKSRVWKFKDSDVHKISRGRSMQRQMRSLKMMSKISRRS